MAKKAKIQCSRRRTGGASEEISADNKYTALTPGLKNVLFTRGKTRDAARFNDTLKQLARYVGEQAWSQSTVTAKAMVELVAPYWTQPAKPVRFFYVTPTTANQITNLMTQTPRRFIEGTTTRIVAMEDDIDWKMTLSKRIVNVQKYRRDVEAWVENSARVYNLVLGHCPP